MYDRKVDELREKGYKIIYKSAEKPQGLESISRYDNPKLIFCYDNSKLKFF